MDPVPLEQVVRNIDDRLTRVEQILPTLATKEDLKAFPTKEEMRQAIAEAVAPLATKNEVREEGERTRRHFDIVAGRLEGQIRLVAEGHGALQQRMDDGFKEVKSDIARLDRRVMKLEVSR